MARTARLLCILLTSVIILVSVETKSRKATASHARRTHQSHTYPSSPGGSGGHRKVTRPPRTGYTSPIVRTTFNTHAYPRSSGVSGGGRQVTSAPTYTPYHTAYPQPKPTTSRTHSYPISNGGSGNRPILDPRTGSYPHPPSPSFSGNTGVVTHGGYNSHVYLRNQQTSVYVSNIPTHIHHYHYNPPKQFYYSSYGHNPVYYPVYTGQLPDYVYEYRASRNRYRKLLAGLALYNLGLVSRNQQIQMYHNHYLPRKDEVCYFGVSYNMYRYDEMEVDCRLMTDFIWSSNQVNQPEMVIGNGMFTSKSVLNALDPKFNGDSVHVESGMKCYLRWTVTYTHPRTNEVDCGLLQRYVDKSLNSAIKVTPVLLIIVASVSVVWLY